MDWSIDYAINRAFVDVGVAGRRQAASREVTLDISGPVAGLKDVGGVAQRDAR